MYISFESAFGEILVAFITSLNAPYLPINTQRHRQDNQLASGLTLGSILESSVVNEKTESTLIAARNPAVPNVIQLPRNPAATTMAPAKPSSPTIHTATEIVVPGNTSNTIADNHGIVGDYQLGLEMATIVPVTAVDGEARFFIWDDETRFAAPDTSWQQAECRHATITDCTVNGNHCVILASEVEGPEIITDGEATRLQLSARWQLKWDTATYSAELGMITLQESQRFIVLENGEQVTVTDSREADAPVLYLQGSDDSEIVKPIAIQQRGAKQQHGYSITVSQHLSESHDGHAVESVSVLEQYRSYFMQRPTDSKARTIWAPLVAPISWGWSIRVRRRYDGEWAIARRKLMMPTVGHDGFELPLWKNNSLSFSSLALL